MAWLTNWNKRKQLNISGTSAGSQSAYQMKITVYYGAGTDSSGKIYCGGNVKGDFSDIRFTDTDGTTLLNHWIETYSSASSATVWIKIPNIPTGSNSTYIYIYYSNPTITTSSNGSTTFDFFDDFIGTSLDTTKWNTVTISGNAGNSLVVSNSNITITADLNDGYGICAKTSFSGSQAFETRGFYILTKPNSTSYLAPVTLLQDNTHHIYDSPTGNGYYSEWLESGSNNARLKRFLAPSTRVILTQTTTTMTANTLYNQSLMLDNATHVLWQINGTNATGQATDSNNYRTNLYAGIQPYTGCKVQVDNAFVRKYVSPEPTFGTTLVEETGTAQTGNLNIRSNPLSARVFIDDIDQAVYTPITITGLTPGTHSITLTKASYTDYTVQVTVITNQITYLSAPIAVGIINGTFNTDLSNWTNTIKPSSECPTCFNSSIVSIWESGKAHIKSASLYDGSYEAFTEFSQRFYLDKPLLVFDAQALISDDGYGSSCGGILGPSPSGCGYVITDDSNNVVAYGRPGTVLTTISIDLTNYINQWLTITFRVGAARSSGYYYDLLIDNVLTAYGSTFRSLCADTAQYCNATLYIDGKYVGTTLFNTYLNLGTHNYSLFKGGYNRYDSSVNITPTEVTTQQTTGMNIDSTLVVGPGGIINPTFDTDISGWVISGDATWDNGRVHLRRGGSISQIIVVTDNILRFDWETYAYWPDDSGMRCQIYVDDVLKLEKRLPGNYWNYLSGTTSIYIGNYIGRVAKIVFYEQSTYGGWEGWIDNISFGHTTGVQNGNFDQGLDGWDTFGDVAVEDWFGPNPTNTNGAVNPGGRLEQTFIIDKCVLTFDWLTSDPTNGYQFFIDGSEIISKTLPQYSSGTETIDVSPYIGNYAKISFWCNGYILAVDNVALSVGAFGVSVISYPPGAEIYLDAISTGQTTGDTPIIIDAGSDGNHIITLKLTNFPDYVETINIVRCVETYVSATFGGCITFITDPPGAKICIDNVDTNEVTSKTFCGYAGTHTYSLYLKNYRVEQDTITFPSDKGFLINKTLTYETGSVRFNVVPNGSKIIIDGTDTGKLTPDTVNNLSIGYHTYEIRNDDFYSLTGSFRIIVDAEKLITESLQQVTGIENGTFTSDISGWTITSSNINQGYVQWLNGQAHLVTTDVPITFYKDFIVTEDFLVFYYYPGVTTNHSCYIGWSILANPGTPQQVTISSYCGWGQPGYDRYEHWGYFEIDIRAYKGLTVRINFNLNGHGPLGVGGPAHAYVDNVGNISNIKRSITFDSYCSTLPECPTSSISITKCYSDVYLDNTYIGIDDNIIAENLSIGTHSYKVRNQDYSSIDTNNQDVPGNITFSQGIFTHTYIDNIWLPTGIINEGCVHFESLPPGLRIYIDGHDTGKVTPATICNISYNLSRSKPINTLTSHTYELKFLNSSYQGTFDLGAGFGEYIYVELYGKIQFDTIPEGARVTLDGVDTGGITPFVPLTIPIGIHTYSFSLANFQDQTCQIEVVYNQTAIVNFEMLSAEGCIYIDSCPRGATSWNSTDISVDGISKGITPLSVCELTGQHQYTLSRVGYDTYTETINMPYGRGINRRINLNRKIGVPSLDPSKEICSLNSSRVIIQSYVTGGIYLGKDAFEMKDGGIEIIDALGYDVIHLYVLYENFWTGTVDGGVWGEVYIYQSDTSGDCSIRWWQTPSAKPADAELIYYRQDGGWNPAGASTLFDGSINISKRYIRIETRVYMCNIFGDCWGDGSSSIFVMEQIPIECPMSPTTSCGQIGLSCTIRTDEGIYSKDRYCYLGEGIFTKRVYQPQLPPLIGTNTISQSCGSWGGVRVECYIGNDGYLVLQNQWSPEQMWTTFEAKGPYIEFYTPYGAWQLKDTTNNTWIVGTGDEWNYGAYVYVSGNVYYEIPTINRGHMLKIFFLFPSPNYRYDHIRNMWYG